jgi:hypothetical protein
MFWPCLAVECNSNKFEKHTTGTNWFRFFTESRLHASLLRIQMFPDTKIPQTFPDSKFPDTARNREDLLSKTFQFRDEFETFRSSVNGVLQQVLPLRYGLDIP